MTNFSRVGLVVRPDDENVANTFNEVIACLQERQIDFVFEKSAQSIANGAETVAFEHIAENCDLVIVIGGDGTLLSSARALADHDVPLIGINRGRLGFLVDVPSDDNMAGLSSILDGDYVEEYRSILETRILRDGECIAKSYALNDTVIRVHERLQIMDYDILIDDALVAHQRADGLIISTPSGSTAYSLSNGGPIVAPTIDTLILNPLCPHTLNSRPLLVDGNSCIKIHLWDDDVRQAQVVCDGQVYMDAMLGDMVNIFCRDKKIRLLHRESYDYHRILREKLGWG